jgi:hypothetical protein
VNHEPAVEQALLAFGSARGLATQLNAAAGTRAMRQAPVIALLAGAAIGAGFLVAATTQTHAAASENATFAAQASFFLAVVAFEIAFVAGVCAASRVAALWRAVPAPSGDREFVSRSTTVSLAALAATATAWVVNMIVAWNRLANPDDATLVAGALIMIVSAATAFMALGHIQINAADKGPGAEVEANGPFGLGERAIALVRRHPVISCLGVVIVSSASAMMHAETTVSGALPWGAIQALAVVLGFAILGPTLGLRPERTDVALDGG